MASNSRLPKDPQVAAAYIVAEQQKLLTEVGWLGRIFGGQRAGSNIACLIGVGAFVALLCVIFREGDAEGKRASAQTFSALITFCLGFLFGRHAKD